MTEAPAAAMTLQDVRGPREYGLTTDVGERRTRRLKLSNVTRTKRRIECLCAQLLADLVEFRRPAALHQHTASHRVASSRAAQSPIGPCDDP